MDYTSISDIIIGLKNADLELRELITSGKFGEGYNEEMAKLHDKNAEKLDEIISNIEYSTVEKIGNS